MRVAAVLLLVAALLAMQTAAAAPRRHAHPRQPAALLSARLGAPGLARALAGFDLAPAGHPRLFAGHADAAGIVAAARAERSAGLAALKDYLKRHPVSALAPALLAQIDADDPAVRGASWWQQDRLLEGIAESAFAWYVSGEPWLLDAMRERMRLFGRPVLARHCSGDIAETRDYAWYFALGYDFAYDQLSGPERELVRDVVATCARAGLARTPAMLRAQPDSAVAFNALGKFVGAMLILRADRPDTARWLDQALPAYVAALSPWGGADGGYANGSSYALWDAGESLLEWDLVERVLHVPLYRKPWLAQLHRFIAYTLPPGTPAGAFGDGAEVKRTEEWARFGKAIAYRSSGPLARWYAARLSGEDPARLQMLLSPRAQPGPAPLPPSQPDSAVFASVGVAAMHSALADPQRVSVLFRSSPYGSVNHAHADQNSFVLYAKGAVLAMDSGYYDAYNSPHWRGWYKQTRAHNAVTFDGGQGQLLGPAGVGLRERGGRIADFSERGALATVVGDAADAYGGDIRLARRTLVYKRPDTLFIIDQLASARPRSWEWNLHTGVPLAGTAAAFEENVGTVRLCGQVVSSAALTLTSVAGYAPPPATPAAPHYWHRFAYDRPSAQGLFVAVLRVGCHGPAPQIRFDAGGAQVTAAGLTLDVGAPTRPVSIIKSRSLPNPNRLPLVELTRRSR